MMLVPAVISLPGGNNNGLHAMHGNRIVAKSLLHKYVQSINSKYDSVALVKMPVLFLKQNLAKVSSLRKVDLWGPLPKAIASV